MNLMMSSRLSALVHCLGAPSISIGQTAETVVLTCLPTHLQALADVPRLLFHTLGPAFGVESGLSSGQILWSGPEGLGRIELGCRDTGSPKMPGWQPVEFIPGNYSPAFSLVLQGSQLDPSGWVYAFNVTQAYLNGRPMKNGLRFEVIRVAGQVVHDASIEKLTLIQAGQVTEFSQAGHLVIWVQDGAAIPDPQAFGQALAQSMREKYLKIKADFGPGELGQAVDIEGLKAAAEHPQDLAALLGLGLALTPRFDRPEPGWDVERYLTRPVVLAGYEPGACVDAGLPVSPEGFAPDWAPRLVPEIDESVPKKLRKSSETLGVLLVERILAGELSLLYLLVEPENRLLAGGQEFISKRPLLLLARQGRKARAIVGDLTGRERLLKLLVSRSGELAKLTRQGVVLERYGLRIDPLLAAVWLVSQAAGLPRGEASSLGRLNRQALSVSLATVQEIEAVRNKKPDPAVDQALAQAVQALQDRRRKLLARLGRD